MQQQALGFASAGAVFAEPDWRGEPVRSDGPGQDLRPLTSLTEQERRLGDWIRGVSCYGWLNAYQARRAAFELQSIRCQHARDSRGAGSRRAIQSRLDRLDGVLEQARATGQR